MIVIGNCDKRLLQIMASITNRYRYYQVWHMLQNVTRSLQSVSGITQCGSYYTVRRNKLKCKYLPCSFVYAFSICHQALTETLLKFGLLDSCTVGNQFVMRKLNNKTISNSIFKGLLRAGQGISVEEESTPPSNLKMCDIKLYTSKRDFKIQASDMKCRVSFADVIFFFQYILTIITLQQIFMILSLILAFSRLTLIKLIQI